VISVEGLRKSYGDVVAVDGVSFVVERGEVFGLLGPNGAGKTTTLEMIEGMLPIDAGRALVNAIDVTEEPRRVRKLIGIQLQQASFFDRLTLRELLTLFADLYEKRGPERNDPTSLLRLVGLETQAGRYVKQLSGGQQQRFGIALALVNDPVVLFLDEPTTGLDPQARRQIWDLVRRLRAEGLSIVLTTHYMEEAQFLCDRVAIMDRGRIVVLDAPSELIRRLVDTGFSRPTAPQPADLEDVFLHYTGRALQEE
jgi:ABC-2 type transport system ATP-binding protein